MVDTTTPPPNAAEAKGDLRAGAGAGPAWRIITTKAGLPNWPAGAVGAVGLQMLSYTYVLIGGGSPDAYCSTDLKTWEGKPMQWTDRTGNVSVFDRNSAAIFNVGSNGILVFGGLGGGGASDHMWYFDGDHWQEFTAKHAPAPRYSAAYVNSSMGQWLMGGVGYDEVGCSDVWVPENGGLTWKQITARAPWGPLDSAASLFDGRTLWLFGGLQRKWAGDLTILNAVWASDDRGASWRAMPTPPWSPRFNAAAVLTSRGIALVGGSTSHGGVDETWFFDGSAWTRDPALDAPALVSGAAVFNDGARSYFANVGVLGQEVWALE